MMQPGINVMTSAMQSTRHCYGPGDVSHLLPLFTGGFFDGKTSAEERRSYLLNVLQNHGSDAGSTGGGGSDATSLSDAALDKLLARSAEELALLTADTARRAAARRGPAAWAAAGTNPAPAAVESVADASASLEPMVVKATEQGGSHVCMHKLLDAQQGQNMPVHCTSLP